mmetsp:Transcript_17313/g.29846  ORF Transcript_17313/g.29846 Transcript_17313/m.29846 type:complete len:250 (+) Transcript_17313:64-813(+)
MASLVFTDGEDTTNDLDMAPSARAARGTQASSQDPNKDEGTTSAGSRKGASEDEASESGNTASDNDEEARGGQDTRAEAGADLALDDFGAGRQRGLCRSPGTVAQLLSLQVVAAGGRKASTTHELVEALPEKEESARYLAEKVGATPPLVALAILPFEAKVHVMHHLERYRNNHDSKSGLNGCLLAYIDEVSSSTGLAAVMALPHQDRDEELFTPAPWATEGVSEEETKDFVDEESNLGTLRQLEKQKS